MTPRLSLDNLKIGKDIHLTTTVTVTRPPNIPATIPAQRIEAWLLGRGVSIIDVRWLEDVALVVTSDDDGVPVLNLEAFDATGDDGRGPDERQERGDLAALGVALSVIRVTPPAARTAEQRALLLLAEIISRRWRLGQGGG